MKGLKIHVINLIAMEKKIHIAVTIAVMAFGLILATVGSAQSGHSQKNATSSASSAAKSAGGAMNKTASNMTSSGGAAAKSAGGAMNKTASSGGAAASNKTGSGNASSSSSSSNPLSKVPVIGKLFGGK
jgi:predicted lipid-binding transport protein (Tim44 family)